MRMSDGQYRALVAYLNFWPGQWEGFTFEGALADIGIDATKAEVEAQLMTAGHDWREEEKRLVYIDDEDDEDAA